MILLTKKLIYLFPRPISSSSPTRCYFYVLFNNSCVERLLSRTKLILKGWRKYYQAKAFRSTFWNTTTRPPDTKPSKGVTEVFGRPTQLRTMHGFNTYYYFRFNISNRDWDCECGDATPQPRRGARTHPPPLSPPRDIADITDKEAPDQIPTFRLLPKVPPRLFPTYLNVLPHRIFVLVTCIQMQISSSSSSTFVTQCNACPRDI